MPCPAITSTRPSPSMSASAAPTLSETSAMTWRPLPDSRVRRIDECRSNVYTEIALPVGTDPRGLTIQRLRESCPSSYSLPLIPAGDGGPLFALIRSHTTHDIRPLAPSSSSSHTTKIRAIHTDECRHRTANRGVDNTRFAIVCSGRGSILRAVSSGGAFRTARARERRSARGSSSS